MAPKCHALVATKHRKIPEIDANKLESQKVEKLVGIDIYFMVIFEIKSIKLTKTISQKLIGLARIPPHVLFHIN